MRAVREFTKGFWTELAPFRLVLGLCPVLAVTKSMDGGFGMGLATTFVLVCSNVIVSLLRNIIPPKVRIASFILIIASFVVIVQMVMEASDMYLLYKQLGIFIPLIVVNCIILGRAEAFASKNGIFLSFADGLGIGLGFTMSLTFLGAIRELFGSGVIVFNWMGEVIFTFSPFGSAYQPFTFMQAPPGAFICLGILLGLMGLIGNRQTAG
ncbi:MAG TPA: electron transport complex subunit E [bacterium]|nr:electron transport complex subunit E [bacterium]